MTRLDAGSSGCAGNTASKPCAASNQRCALNQTGARVFEFCCCCCCWASAGSLAGEAGARWTQTFAKCHAGCWPLPSDRMPRWVSAPTSGNRTVKTSSCTSATPNDVEALPNQVQRNNIKTKSVATKALLKNRSVQPVHVMITPGLVQTCWAGPAAPSSHLRLTPQWH